MVVVTSVVMAVAVAEVVGRRETVVDLKVNCGNLMTVFNTY